ncbi:MAG: hypothetical protein ACXABY_24760 [Candidatus Thorarchaeota archaeon]|jgi:hypothetical protein
MKVCVSCQSDVEGKKALRVKEDRIIRSIRTVKRFFNIAQLNELYVCEDDIKKHMERRRSFEKSLLFASVFAGIIFVLVVAVLIMSGNFDMWAFVSAFIVGGFLLVLPIFKYAPALEGKDAVIVPRSREPKKAPKKRPAKKKR